MSFCSRPLPQVPRKSSQGPYLMLVGGTANHKSDPLFFFWLPNQIAGASPPRQTAHSSPLQLILHVPFVPHVQSAGSALSSVVVAPRPQPTVCTCRHSYQCSMASPPVCHLLIAKQAVPSIMNHASRRWLFSRAVLLFFFLLLVFDSRHTRN